MYSCYNIRPDCLLLSTGRLLDVQKLYFRYLITMSFFNPATIIYNFHLPEPPYPLALTISVALSIFSEWLSFRLGSLLCKFAASVTLLSAGLEEVYSKFHPRSLESLLSQENRFAAFVIPGLLLSCIGDILLTHPKSNHVEISKHKTEKAHLRLKCAKIFSSFAHLAYISAFVTSVDLSSKQDFRRADFVMTMIFGALLVDWLGLFQGERRYDSWFEIPKDLEWPIFVYSSISITMVAAATASDNGYQRIAGAWLLVLSDLFVVSNVFGVDEVDTKKDGDGARIRRLEWMTTSVGWIAYGVSQLLLVGCI